MNKGGQFFLIAALVIVGIIIGVSVVYNSVQSQNEDTSLYDLSDKLNYEGLQVIDQGIKANLPQASIQDNIQSLTKNYYENIQNEDTEIIVIYGDKSTYYLCDQSGDVTLGGTVPTCVKTSTNAKTTIEGSTVKVRFCKEDSQDCTSPEYNFELSGDQSFYIILKKTDLNQQTVTTSADTQGDAGLTDAS